MRAQCSCPHTKHYNTRAPTTTTTITAAAPPLLSLSLSSSSGTWWLAFFSLPCLASLASCPVTCGWIPHRAACSQGKGCVDRAGRGGCHFIAFAILITGRRRRMSFRFVVFCLFSPVIRSFVLFSVQGPAELFECFSFESQ